MTFQFKRHSSSGDVAEVAYELPALPAGVSGDLYRAIQRYGEAVREGPDDADEEAFLAVKAFDARNVQDVIAKLLYQLHFNHRGLDGETNTLVIIENNETATAAIEFAAVALDELYRQIPQCWESARKAYHAAVLAEKEYDDRAWSPAYHVSEAGGPPIPDAVNSEYERLQEVRTTAEDVLLTVPAPSISEWAIKYLICFDNGRECTGAVDLLCSEAKRLLGIREREQDAVDDLVLLQDVAVWQANASASVGEEA
ncbi:MULTISPECIES: hypothetical protein [Novosphingobium]|uniref:hypothetical protein n=1 Tax=Novosphingobium TaxID=165696 RepID=UPI0022F24D53|nr:hypothetical protein [Novosphingobium resinovorum]GLK44455.1 hypothetical protein GCM10017612_23750 [Novosphingobium resinovorum]